MNEKELKAREKRVKDWRSEVVRHYPVLEELPPALTLNLKEGMRPLVVPAGTVAFDEDSRCEGFSLLSRGSVRVVRSGPQGREILLYRVRPGESCILSVCCLLSRSSYTARGVVETDVAGASIPAAIFETLVAEAPAFRTFVFDLFGQRVAALMQLVEEVAFHRLDRRIAALLAQRFAESPNREIRMTHQVLADQVGSAREIVSRVLESFESDGVVTLGRGRLTLLNANGLKELAGDLARPVPSADVPLQ